MKPVNLNIYHRYLELPFEYPKPEIFDQGYHKIIKCLDDTVVDPVFGIWIESLGLHLFSPPDAFYTPPNGGSISLHSDVNWLPGHYDICNLNFTWGPSNSVTRWYQARNESDITFIKNYDVNPEIIDHAITDLDIDLNRSADIKNVDLVYEAVIDRPSLLNVGQLHSTYNPGTEHRWTLVFNLCKQDGKLLQFSDALEIFRDYIQ